MLNNQNLATPKSRESGSNKTTRLTHTQHALNNPKSRKHSLNAKFWDCCGVGLTQAESKGVRKEIALCNKNEKSTVRFEPARALDSFTKTNEVN